MYPLSFCLGVVIPTLGLSVSIQFGGGTGPQGIIWGGVAGIVGKIFRGGGDKRPPDQPKGGGVGKNIVCLGVRRHVD